MATNQTQLYENLEWPKLIERFCKGKSAWKPGEHVALVGPTGVGKTTLLARILKPRPYKIVFVTKTYDPTITKDFKGYDVVEEWPRRGSPNSNNILLWPKADKGGIRATIEKQKAVFKHALDRIYQDRNWTVVFDEQHYMSTTLGLAPEIAMYLHQGRSSGLSVVNGTQRPAWVPVVTYSASTHGFLWKTTFQEDLKRVSDLGGLDRKELAAQMLTLGKHDFVYIDTRKGYTARSKVK